MSTNSPYRYRYAAAQPPRPSPLLRIATAVGATLAALLVLAVLVNGIRLARVPRPTAQPTPVAAVPAALSPAAVAQPADTIEGLPLAEFWARYQTPTAWHVVAHTDSGWVYFCDGDRNGGTYWRKCAGSGRCDDTACSFPTEAAVEEFVSRLISDYHVSGAVTLKPLGWTPPPAPLGAKSGWNGQRALPPGEVK